MGIKYEYNFENATEKRESQRLYGRIDIPHDAPEKHPEHLWQHNHLQELQRHALNGDVEKCKEMLNSLQEDTHKDIMLLLDLVIKRRK
mgnify:CR=1 FL=1